MLDIIWLPQAENDLGNILDYLQKNWGENIVDEFILKLERILSLVSQKPNMFRRSSKMNVHQVLITKHNLLFYRILENKIELLTIFDTRQNPVKKPF
jgi:plasmid stabilization system protein ParE